MLLNTNKITQQSQLLKERIENGQLAICGGVYRLKTAIKLALIFYSIN